MIRVTFDLMDDGRIIESNLVKTFEDREACHKWTIGQGVHPFLYLAIKSIEDIED